MEYSKVQNNYSASIAGISSRLLKAMDGRTDKELEKMLPKFEPLNLLVHWITSQGKRNKPQNIIELLELQDLMLDNEPLHEDFGAICSYYKDHSFKTLDFFLAGIIWGKRLERQKRKSRAK